MDSETTTPIDQTTYEIIHDMKVVNVEKDMNGETISHPKETEKVDEEATLKVECSTNAEAGDKSKNEDQPIVEDVTQITESSNKELSDSVVLSCQVEEKEAKPQQKAEDETHEEESKKQHEFDTQELPPASVEKVEENVAAVSEAGEIFDSKNQPIIEDVKEDAESSNNELSGSVVLSGQIEEEEAKPQQKAEDEVYEEESKEQHESDTQELSPGSVEKAEENVATVSEARENFDNKSQPIIEDVKEDTEPSNKELSDSVVLSGQVEEEEAKPPLKHEVHEEESKKQHESDTPELSPVSVEKAEENVAAVSEAGEDNKNQPIVEDVKEDTESSNKELFDSVVLSGQVEEEEAKPQLKAEDEVLEEQSKNQHESDTPELSPVSVETAEENVAAVSEAGEDNKNQPIVEDVKEDIESSNNELPSSDSVVLSGQVEEEEAKPQQKAEDEVHEEESKKQHESDTPELSPLSVEKAEENVAAVNETVEDSDNKNQPIVEDVKEDKESSNQMLSDSVVLSGQVVEEEAKTHQETADKIHEDESKKQEESATPELSEGSVEKVEGNMEELLVKEPESEAAKDQVVSELADELKTKNPEFTDISTIPSSVSETEDKMEEPVAACTDAEPASKKIVEASQDEEFAVEAQVTGEHSEEKISSLNRSEDEMKVEENFAQESIDAVPVAAELIEAGGALAVETSNKLENCDGETLAQKDIKETVEERLESCEAEDTVKEVTVGAGLTEPPPAINPAETTVAKSVVGTAEIFVEPDVTVNKQETLEVEEPVMVQGNEANSASEIAEVFTKKETDDVSLEAVKDESLENKNEGPLETMYPVKEIEASIATLAIETTEEIRDQQEASKVEEKVVDQANEAVATSETIQDSSEEENDIVKTETVEDKDNSLDNLNESHLETTDPVKDEAIDIVISEPRATSKTQSTDTTSAIQTADDITQPAVEVTPEKQVTLTEVEEPLVTETNKVDSASVDAEDPSEGEKANVCIEKVEDKKDDILEEKTSMDIPNGANVTGEIPCDEVKNPEDADMVSGNIDPSQVAGKDKDMDSESLKDDNITLVDTSKNLDIGSEIAEASLEVKRGSDGEGTKDEIEKSINLDACDIAEISTELEKSSIIAEVEEEKKYENLVSDKVSSIKSSKEYDVISEVAEPELEKSNTSTELVEEKYENSPSNKINLGENDKDADADADAVQDKKSQGAKVVQEKANEDKDDECSITKESKNESTRNEEKYMETAKDIDMKEKLIVESTATDSVGGEKDKESAKDKEESEKPKDESLVLDPKCVDVMNIEEETPRQNIPAKPSPRHSNKIISKVKQSIVKAKKAIMGKSPSSKNMGAKSKEEIK